MRALGVDGRIRQAAGVWGIDVLGGNGDFHSTDGWLCTLYGDGDLIDPSLITDGVVSFANQTTSTTPTSTRVASRARTPYRPPTRIAVDMWCRRNTASTQACFATFWAGTPTFDVSVPTNAVVFNPSSSDMDWHHIAGAAVPGAVAGATLGVFRISGAGWDVRDVTFIAQY